MGRLEKIVVLTVLFLVAVVLGVALTPTGASSERGQRGGPIAGTEDVEKGGAPAKPDERLLNVTIDTKTNGAQPEAPVAKEQPIAGTTNAPPVPPVVTPPVVPDAPVKPVEPPKYILTLDGLTPSNAADMMFYKWKQGDTFAGLATRYYGSKEKIARLQKANEGRTEASMTVDETLWIPIAESSPTTPLADQNQVYVVKKGDVLSGISQQFYGTSKKWQKILDANRDTLASPEKLKPGMRLRIPE
ncbi:MAG TPA: LysM peptidoglycan-binding domain-containing protein [Planctomycetota bacterium]|nr:LysM peptidoglycan-binding domain-containing protein [Planctomycetota bacterium]